MIDGLVSVIMTNFNTPEEYLRESIESVLNQTYENFEFIIVDDCSNDNSIDIIESYKDTRIKLYKNKENLCLTKSLNIALAKCSGEFIARMDSDDVSLPSRFEKQVAFLKNNNDVIVCGTWVDLIGNWNEHHSRNYIRRTIPNRDKYRIMLMFGNYPNIAHTSAMFNHNKILEYGISYNDNYIYAQDFRMWVSCSEVAECFILEETLCYVRVRSGNISTSKKDIQDNCVESIIREQLGKLNLELSDDIKSYHLNLFSRKRIKYDLILKRWFNTIIEANNIYNIYNKKALKELFNDKWSEVCYYALIENKSYVERVKILMNLGIHNIPKIFKIYFKKKII